MQGGKQALGTCGEQNLLGGKSIREIDWAEYRDYFRKVDRTRLGKASKAHRGSTKLAVHAV
jgi:hypothetical protein